MKAYILSVAGAVLLTAVVSIVCPAGRMGKFVRGIGKLVILAVMLSPLFSLIGNKKPASFAFGGIGTDAGYLTRCAEMLEEADGGEIARYLKEKFEVTAEAETARGAEDGFPLRKISVKIVDFGIIGQDEHIHILTRIKEALEEKYNCPAEVA